MNTEHEYTKVYLYEYVNGQKNIKGQIWEPDRFRDFTSGLEIVSQDNRNELTKVAQERLNWLGYQLEEDGLYGEKTIAAVRDFQKKLGLNLTGMIDDATWEALNYFGMYQLFINGCIEGSWDDKVLYLVPWRNLNRAEACKILTSPLN
jgi:peptidoglycan hydrolase-like protein with peptidoglycan-binding domain